MLVHILTSFLIFLLTIGILIGVHEWGHFCVARWFGIKILRFSIGFGKSVWSHRGKDGTEYSIGLVPLGGYVKMLDAREGVVSEDEYPLAFNHQSLLKRFAVISAGPVTNISFAVLVFWFSYILGFISPVPIIGKVLPGTIASQAGLQAGHEIIAIDQYTTTNWQEVAMALIMRLGEQGKMTFTLRDPLHLVQHQYSLSLTHWAVNDLQPALYESLGFTPYHSSATHPALLRLQKYTPFSAVRPALNETYTVIAFNDAILYKLITGTVSLKALGGPLTLLRTSVQISHYGLSHFLRFLGFISISIAIINLLPIPGLDGGHLLYLGIERLRGRPISIATEVLFFKLGMILIIVLMVQGTINDILRLKT